MKTGSNRSFGFLIGAIFLLISAFNYWGGGKIYFHFLVFGIVFFVVAVVMPRVLAPLTRLWLKLGFVLHFIAGPLILGLAYILAIVPTSLAIRLFGKDLLSLRLDRSVPSYWVHRQTPLIRPESLKDQF